MEFSVKKFDLLEELQLTQGVVERKTTIPILSNLLFEAKGNRLTITATDLELSIRTSCEAKVKKEGAGTIPAKKLLEIVRLLPEEEIRFKLLENHWVQVTSDRRNYKLVGMSKENFPALPQFPHALVKIPAKLLADLIAKTTFAISLEESRYTLNGASWSSSPVQSPWLPPTAIASPWSSAIINSKASPPKRVCWCQEGDDGSAAPRRRIGTTASGFRAGRKSSLLPVRPAPAHSRKLTGNSRIRSCAPRVEGVFERGARSCACALRCCA